jgi:hypothetical protein
VHAAVDFWRTHTLGRRRLALASCGLWHKLRRFEMHRAFGYWRTHVLQVLGSRLLCHKLRRQAKFVAFASWCTHLLVKQAQKKTEDLVRQRARWRGWALCRELFRLWVIMSRTQRRVVQAACQWKVGGGHMVALVQTVFVEWRAQGLRSVRSRCVVGAAQNMKLVCVSDTHRSKWPMCIIVILYFCTRRSHPGRYGVLSSPKRIVTLPIWEHRMPESQDSEILDLGVLAGNSVFPRHTRDMALKSSS